MNDAMIIILNKVADGSISPDEAILVLGEMQPSTYIPYTPYVPQPYSPYHPQITWSMTEGTG